ncbi:hypothetical protein NEUTE1DRAFT_82782 [Neurospora tetrasperma FGSC 2508]|uniref:Uncharacterized protein n=1 Tax=Neurospora tetrasperma (strain FGSC 2508 / ATCC MYA-4615 / P0657) TaxID=510951 RepID=F8ML07_NEUT8|nr:uncharacterized protein NEUTE1DRAFT_82782 [Neurospora tetrasperma FGSC 2508]EGO58332.1 hypothetical protein NEUTE1DRAFT_82782 [Neurospora tetrasperma FGSC 2508]EGZ71345.1 hypothetical protein NEUTE2DRAFT_109780 [Neurospora tetrasperma FGSC 2509]
MASSSSSRAPDRTPRNPRGPAVRTDAGASDRAANRLPDLPRLMDPSPEAEPLTAGPPTQSNPNQQRRTPSTPVPIPQQGSSPTSGSDHFYSARQTPAQSQSPAPDLSTERQIDVDSYAFHVNSLVHPARRTERDLERLPRYDPRNPSASPASRSDSFHSARETPVASQSPAANEPVVEVQIDPSSYEFQVNSLVHPVRRTEHFEERFDPTIRSRLRGPDRILGMSWDDCIRLTNDRLLADGAEEKDLICKARHTDQGCTCKTERI